MAMDHSSTRSFWRGELERGRPGWPTRETGWVLTVRPILGADVPEVEEVWNAAYSAMRATHHMPPEPRDSDRVSWGRRRTAHLLATDPAGSWLAEISGDVVGMAQSNIRGDRWTLSNLGVAPDHQTQGVGKALLERTLDYGAKCSAGAIFSSPDPRAVHRYAAAGFVLHPAVVARGPVRRAVTDEGGVLEMTTEGLAQIDQVDERVRGGTRRPDIEFQLSLGHRILLSSDGNGYVVVRGGHVATLAAHNQGVARRLLRAHLARCDREESITVGWMRAGDQWAIETLVEAGVALHVHGAVMLRGEWEPHGAYLPNGLFG